MKLGAYELTAINDGHFGLDGGAMFGTVPRVLWERRHPPDGTNRIRMSLRTLLIRSQERTILVDTGIGGKFGEKQVEMFAIEREAGGLLAGLEAMGVAPGDVTDVVISHLHFDHAGGAVERLADGRLVPAFPGARVHIQADNLETACCPNRRERASYLQENVHPLRESGRLQLHHGRAEIAPGVEVLRSDGHTRGMQMVRVSEPGGRTVLFPADLIPTSSHLRLPWVMGYDLFPLTVMDEKAGLLADAVRERWIVVFEHDAALAACEVKHDGKDFTAGDPVDL